MQFCPNCDNTFVITRINQDEQQAQQVQEEVKQARQHARTTKDDSESNPESETSNVDSGELIKLDKLDKIDKIEGGANINKQEKNSDLYYFKCTNCGYIVPIEEDTLIIRRTNENKE